MNSVRQLVEQYISATGGKQYDRLADVVHPDATFGGTVRSEARGRDAFVQGFRNLGAITLRHDVKQMVVDGNNAAVLYDLVTDTDVGAVLCSEFLTTDGELITSSTLIFDWRRWPDVLAALQSRAQS
jgi:hypothetical protein